MVDQKTIAEKAGVSRATVSRAFTQNANISPKTLAKIQDAMVELGLQPIAWLPSEVKKKNKYVLVIAGDIANHFFSQVIKGICDRLLILGLLPVVCNSNYDSQIEESQIEMADSNNYLGIIMITAMEHPTLSATLRKIKTPVVFVNRYLRSVDADTVCIDNYQGGYMAAEYLMDKGHRNIAHVASYRGSTPQEDRIQGFAAALEDRLRGQNLYNVFYGEGSLERGRKFALELLQKGMPYTALFVTDCQIAVGIATALRDHGYRIPEDLSILCFDDSPYIDEAGLRLSTVTYDPYAMGQNTIDLLMQRLASATDSVSRLNLMPRLIERDSVADLMR